MRRRELLSLTGLPLLAAAGDPLPSSRPLGIEGDVTLLRDWRFGTAPGRIGDMTSLRREFRFRYIWDGGRGDGLPRNYWSRHRDYPDGDPRALHVFTPEALLLKARIPPGGGLRQDGIESGMLRGLLPVTPGMILEMRARLPRGIGTWPAFWLAAGVEDEAGRFSATPWPPEIDIFEFFNWQGRRRPRVMATNVQSDGRPAEFGHPADVFSLFRDGEYAPGIDFSAGWHVFALDWQPDLPSWRLDGRLIRQTRYHWRAPPAHLLVTNQIGMNFPGVDLSGMAAPDDDWDLAIDSLRIWRRR